MTLTRRLSSLLVLALLAAPVTGCMMYGRTGVGIVYISREPPIERVEVIPEAPGVGFVWLKGYWAWRGAEFEWVPGRWEHPAEGRKVWVAHHWEHDRNGWYLVEGHWR